MEGTSLGSSDYYKNKSIAALVNGRGLGDLVGLATFDLKSTVCTFFQFIDTPSFPRTIQLLLAYKVEQILIPIKSEQKYDLIYEAIKAYLPTIELIPISRQWFNDETGLDYIKKYVLEDDQHILSPYLVNDFYYGLCCIGCIFYYFENDQKLVFPSNRLHFKYKKCDSTLLIDSNTMQNLEIVKNLQDAHSTETLLNVMDHTFTPMGHRLLRLSICQPYSDISTINSRLNCIEELRDNRDKLNAIKVLLKGMPDIDVLASMVTKMNSVVSIKAYERNIQSSILAKRICLIIKDLALLVAQLKNPVFTSIHKIISNEKVDKIKIFLETYLNEDININSDNFYSKNIKCFALKPGLNGLLDVARKAYVETSEDIYNLVNKYENDYNLPFRVKVKTNYGFEITLNAEAIEGKILPDIFIKAKKTRNVLHLKTLDLIRLNDRHKNAQDEVYLMSKEFILKIIIYLQSEIGFINRLSESVAMLDLMVSNTIASINNDYVRPEFSDNLIIKQARHPILSSKLKKRCIPNNIYGDNYKRLIFIMGPNMSGKTTYLKTVALLVIMAQSGSYVPAEYASIKIFEYLHSRFSSKRDNEGTNSSFYKELSETASILHDVNKKSLVLFDELGRGTSPNDGLPLCYAICEFLISSNCLAFFSTHFQELANYLKVYPSVMVLSMKVQELFKNGKYTLKFDHYAQEEDVEIEHYGIKLAAQMQLPKELVDEAYKISNQIKQIQDQNQEAMIEKHELQNQKTIIELGQILTYAAKESTLEPKEMVEFINSLKQKYLKKEAPKEKLDDDY